MEQIKLWAAPLLAQLDGLEYWQAVVIVLVTFLLARTLAWLLLRIFRLFTSRTKTRLDDKLFERLRAPLIWTIIVLGLTWASQLLPYGEVWHGRVVAVLRSISVVVWMFFFMAVSNLLLTKSMSGSHPLKFIQPQTLPLFRNMLVLVLVGAAVYLIFSIWGVDMTAWLASAGIIGIAVGFAAKDTLANLFSGVFILADMPYKLGDYVVLDTGERGAVTHIGLRSTRMLTRDDVELTIPNSIMGNSKIVNESGGPYEKFRIRVPVGVAYGSDIDQVRELLLAEAKANESVCRYPEARVRFRAFGPSSLDFQLLCWVDEPAVRGRVLDELLSAIYKSFRDHDIEIPFTKQDLYIKEIPGEMSGK